MAAAQTLRKDDIVGKPMLALQFAAAANDAKLQKELANWEEQRTTGEKVLDGVATGLRAAEFLDRVIPGPGLLVKLGAHFASSAIHGGVEHSAKKRIHARNGSKNTEGLSKLILKQVTFGAVS